VPSRQENGLQRIWHKEEASCISSFFTKTVTSSTTQWESAKNLQILLGEEFSGTVFIGPVTSKPTEALSENSNYKIQALSWYVLQVQSIQTHLLFFDMRHCAVFCMVSSSSCSHLITLHWLLIAL